jgi:hypothetical protein
MEPHILTTGTSWRSTENKEILIYFIFNLFYYFSYSFFTLLLLQFVCLFSAYIFYSFIYFVVLVLFCHTVFCLGLIGQNYTHYIIKGL